MLRKSHFLGDLDFLWKQNSGRVYLRHLRKYFLPETAPLLNDLWPGCPGLPDPLFLIYLLFSSEVAALVFCSTSQGGSVLSSCNFLHRLFLASFSICSHNFEKTACASVWFMTCFLGPSTSPFFCLMAAWLNEVVVRAVALLSALTKEYNMHIIQC